MDFDYILKNHVADKNLLLKYGFVYSSGVYSLEKSVCGGDFISKTSIDGSHFCIKLYDSEFGDEYNMIAVEDAQGAYVGQVRAEVNALAEDIVKHCFTSSGLRDFTIKYIADKYGVLPEYPWADSPNSCTFKHPKNKKWFGLIMDIPQEKLTKKGKNIVDVINLKNTVENIKTIVDNKSVFPAYHMNKTHWISVLLDSRTQEEDLKKLIDESYGLIDKK